MDLSKYLAIVIVLFVDSGETGGHGGKHHDHVKLHMPEFIHHDHHTKVITIHHHHHKPKKEHHHHHHHHHQPKPHIPHHHYNHHHHKTTLKTTTVSKGHKQAGHGHSGHHGHHSHHGGSHGSHGGHYGHHGSSHHDTPSFNHNIPSVSHDPGHVSFEDDFKSFTPSIPVNIPNNPHVHGVVHTVKQVKVFDSLPGSIKSNSGSGSNGYEVTEEGEEGDEDAFTSINTIPQTYQGTYGFVRNAAQAENYPGVALQSAVQLNHDPFSAAPGPSAFSGLENFSSDGQDSFPSSFANQGTNGHTLPEFSGQTEQISGFDDPENSFVGNDISGTSLLSAEANDDIPVTYSREAGIQQSVKTGGLQTVVY
ncbi:PREDICTED: protein doublesex-like [Papilio xuthus]|uniref:Protein doublesex-like n=1 Tax=Papilio xuthus TaxID=66420 RepID=A0A194PS63_PAPXU|nr:PREDICTED: protein doublesex-like [Papilio xuthus]KPI96152.1 hypothetical protein RR46_06886 [Papilio xuthus]